MKRSIFLAAILFSSIAAYGRDTAVQHPKNSIPMGSSPLLSASPNSQGILLAGMLHRFLVSDTKGDSIRELRARELRIWEMGDAIQSSSLTFTRSNGAPYIWNKVDANATGIDNPLASFLQIYNGDNPARSEFQDLIGSDILAVQNEFEAGAAAEGWSIPDAAFITIKVQTLNHQYQARSAYVIYPIGIFSLTGGPYNHKTTIICQKNNGVWQVLYIYPYA